MSQSPKQKPALPDSPQLRKPGGTKASHKRSSKHSGGIDKQGLYYQRGFITPQDRTEILEWLATLHPIWEMRYSQNNPPPEGDQQRGLLRPVYWLGNWQFACLDYYHPPNGVKNRCVTAEPFPPVLRRAVDKIEARVRKMYQYPALPRFWHLNTCLVNFYGSRIESNGKRTDTARVGEHKDFEPGPVASISLGDRALFQFVSSQAKGSRDGVYCQDWLEDCSLQIFGEDQFKKRLFHRVQRVEDKRDELFPPAIPGFETRRVNFTFRYVPDEHIVPYSKLSAAAADDVQEYMQELAQHSEFFKKALQERHSK